jgi:hypothetical protein
MDAEYTTLESIKEAYGPAWDESWDTRVTRQIAVVSAFIWGEFNDRGRDLDAEILSGKTKAILVEEVANSMLARKISSYEDDMGVGDVDWTNLSKSVGPFNLSVGRASGSGSLYMKKDERALLKLGNISLGAVSYTYLDPMDGDGYVLVP